MTPCVTSLYFGKFLPKANGIPELMSIFICVLKGTNTHPNGHMGN